MGPTREMMPYGKFWSRSTWIIFTTVMAFTSERERERSQTASTRFCRAITSVVHRCSPLPGLDKPVDFDAVLSGGERQRLGFARLLLRPNLCLRCLGGFAVLFRDFGKTWPAEEVCDS